MGKDDFIKENDLLQAGDVFFHEDLEREVANLHHFLGSKIVMQEDEKGVLFQVYAPNAWGVHVVGDFIEDWEYGLPMKKDEETGVWSLFTTEACLGSLYKYKLTQADGKKVLRSDPFSFDMEKWPNFASIVSSDEKFHWTDEEYKDKRRKKKARSSPLTILKIEKDFFEGKDFSKVLHEIASVVTKRKITHIQLPQVFLQPPEDESDVSTYGFYEMNGWLEKKSQLKMLVDKMHGFNIGVLSTCNLATFLDSEEVMSYYDGTALFEYRGKFRGKNQMLHASNFDVTKPFVKNFWLSVLKYWFETYHLDGLVFKHLEHVLYLDQNQTAWQPNIEGKPENIEGLQFVQELVHFLEQQVQGVVSIACDKTNRMKLTHRRLHGSLGIDYKLHTTWDKNLSTFFSLEPMERGKNMHLIMDAFQSILSDHYALHLPKKVVSSFWGSSKEKEAQYRLAQTMQKLLPTISLAHTIQKRNPHPEEEFKEINLFMESLEDLYLTHPYLYQEQDSFQTFELGDVVNAPLGIIAFERSGKTAEERLIVLLNVLPQEAESVYIGVDSWGEYEEVLNSGLEMFGGSWKKGNTKIQTIPWNTDSSQFQLELDIPALSAIVIRPKKISKSIPQKVVKMLNDASIARSYKQKLDKQNGKQKWKLF